LFLLQCKWTFGGASFVGVRIVAPEAALFADFLSRSATVTLDLSARITGDPRPVTRFEPYARDFSAQRRTPLKSANLL